jgi:hypothetical protein
MSKLKIAQNQGSSLGNAVGVLDTSFQSVTNKLNQLKSVINVEIDNTVQAVVELERQSAQTLQRLQQIQMQQQQARVSTRQGGTAVRNNLFNLKKYSQAPQIPQVPMPINNEQTKLDLSSFDNFYHFLSNSNYEVARNAILSEKNSDGLADAVKDFYSPESTESDKALVAAKIFEVLQSETGQDRVVEGTPERVNNQGNVVAKGSLENIVLATEKQIKDMIQAESKKFNLKKTASFDNNQQVLWGPSSKRISPFNESFLESDYDVYERNKGWGFRIGDIWDIDFETIWRGTIMDKYSQAYRDKEGNWVGGYIQKRFEVDKNIPDITNIQLKPGEIRKQRPAELGLIEARMQLARDKKTVVDGNDVEYAPFNLTGPKDPKIVNAFNNSKKKR